MNGQYDDDFTAKYWNERVELKDDPRSVRVDGVQYVIGAEDSPFPMRGHGGRDFFIVFDDGRLTHSTNLWLNGDVPERFKEELPDNATFFGRKEFEELVKERGWQDGPPRMHPAEEAPLERAEREIRDIKAKDNHKALVVSEDPDLGYNFVGFTPVGLGNWNDWNDRQKLVVLERRVNWEGVEAGEKRQVIEREVDLRNVSPKDQHDILGEVWHRPETYDQHLRDVAERGKYRSQDESEGKDR